MTARTATASPSPTGVMSSPTFWGLYRSELYKWSKQRFFRVIVGLPLLVAVAFIVGQTLLGVRLSVGFGQSVLSIFDFWAEIFLQGFGGIYALLIVLACIWHVANEYNWKTIKMLATRQASRTKIVLAKCLFSLSLVLGIYASFILSWLALSTFVTLISGVPFAITPTDLKAIGDHMARFAMFCLSNFIWGLFAMAATFQARAVAGGILIHVLYSNLDIFLSAANLNYTPVGGLIGAVIEIIKAIQPYLLSANLNRIAQSGRGLAANVPLEQAWIVVGFYVMAFIGLAIFIFARRDITD
jgi:ABC-type transport system involved in multi-copper enzyme maturation permease subunit